MKPRPIDPLPQPRPSPIVHKLRVKQSIQCKIAAPLEPTLRPNGAANVRLHHNGPRILLPGPAQVRGSGVDGAQKVGIRRDVAELKGESGGLIGVLPALRGDGVFLVGEAFLGEDGAVLEDGGGIAENEVDGAADVAVAEELAHRVGVKGVLVACNAASEEHREIGVGSQRHRLVLLRSGGVLECYIARYESSPANSCKLSQISESNIFLFSFPSLCPFSRILDLVER